MQSIVNWRALRSAAQGASAGELPIEEPTKFELVINRHTADAFGIQLPSDLLASADRLIE